MKKIIIFLLLILFTVTVSAQEKFLGATINDQKNEVSHETNDVYLLSTNLVKSSSNDWYIFDVNITTKTFSPTWDLIVTSEENVKVELATWKFRTRTKQETSCTIKEITHPNSTKENQTTCQTTEKNVTGFDWDTTSPTTKLETSDISILRPDEKLYIFREFDNTQTKRQIRITGFPRGNPEKFNFIVIPSGDLKTAILNGLGAGLDPTAQGSLKPVGLWNLSFSSWDPINSLVLDRSGNGLHLTNNTALTNLTAVDGRNGSVLDFNGSTINLELTRADDGVNDQLKLNQTNFTVSFWVNFDQLDLAQGIVGKGESGIGDWEILKTVTEGPEAFQIIVNNENSFSVQTADVGGWFHVLIINNGTKEFYINGTFDDSDANFNLSNSSNTQFLVGNRPGGSGNLDGQLWCLQIYNFSMNSTEINAMHQNPNCDSLEEIFGQAQDPLADPVPSPVITGLFVVNITETTAITNWTTDINSNTSINYGTTLDLGTITETDDDTTTHTASLTGLLGDTFIFVNATSCNSNATFSNCTTQITNFTTQTTSFNDDGCSNSGSGSAVCQVLSGTGTGTGNVLDAITFPIIILIAVLGIITAVSMLLGRDLLPKILK